MPRRHPLLLSFLLAALAVLAACSAFHDDVSLQLLRPPGISLTEPADFGLPAEPFEIELGSEASLTGWWIPNPASDGRTIVLFHEEATNASVAHPYYRFLHEAGFSVLAFDPRGFGRSRGKATLRAWLYDLGELFDWLEGQKGVDPDRIALFGTSMGSVAAMWAARTHPRVRAVVFEHLPSITTILREGLGDDGTALSAYTLGALQFSLPENIDPVDSAPKVHATGLFLATEHEDAKDRLSLLDTFDAYAGRKVLWVLPGAMRAPHAMLVHDGEYQRGILDFLDRALSGRPMPLKVTTGKLRDAAGGGAWYELRLELTRGRDTAPWAIEACAILADGTPHYARAWVETDRGSVRLKLPNRPAHVTARRVFDATPDPEQVFVARPTHLTRSGAAIAPLWPRIDELRNGVLGREAAAELAADIEKASATEPFDPVVEAELADVYARIGLLLDDEAWLRRAVKATPEHPERHFWPGPVPTYGSPWIDVIEAARRRLAQ